MILPEIEEIQIAKVLHRGLANKECVALRVVHRANTGQYGLLIGYRDPTSLLTRPYTDQFFWLGEAIVNPGDWIFAFTGGGEANKVRLADDTGDAYFVHWGRSMTMFANSNVVPILFRMDSANLGEEARDVEQRPLLPPS
jgi:hypothetical protein